MEKERRPTVERQVLDLCCAKCRLCGRFVLCLEPHTGRLLFTSPVTFLGGVQDTAEDLSKNVKRDGGTALAEVATVITEVRKSASKLMSSKPRIDTEATDAANDNNASETEVSKSLFQEFQDALTSNITLGGGSGAVDGNQSSATANSNDQALHKDELDLLKSPTKISIGHEGYIHRVSLAKATKKKLSSPLYKSPRPGKKRRLI